MHTPEGSPGHRLRRTSRTPVKDAELAAAIAAERSELAAVLAGLPDHLWEAAPFARVGGYAMWPPTSPCRSGFRSRRSPSNC